MWKLSIRRRLVFFGSEIAIIGVSRAVGLVATIRHVRLSVAEVLYLGVTIGSRSFGILVSSRPPLFLFLKASPCTGDPAFGSTAGPKATAASSPDMQYAFSFENAPTSK